MDGLDDNLTFHHLSGVYQLGATGFSAGFSVASDAFGIGRGDFLCWNHYHDYFIWNDSFQPDERPIE